MKKIITYTAWVLLHILSLAAVWADEPADIGNGTAGEGSGTPAAPPYVLDVFQTEKDKPALSDVTHRNTAHPVDRTGSPRGFMDVFYGTVNTDDGTASAAYQDCFLYYCGAGRSASRNVHFDRSDVFGIRIGAWLRNYPYLGMAADFSYLHAQTPEVSVWYVPISFAIMGRYGVLKNGDVPDGRLQMYGGLMLAEVIGDIEVDLTPQITSQKGGFTFDLNLGVGGIAGIGWHFPSYAVFCEYRMLNAGLTYDANYDFLGISKGSESASVDLHTKQVVMGISFKFY